MSERRAVMRLLASGELNVEEAAARLGQPVERVAEWVDLLEVGRAVGQGEARRQRAARWSAMRKGLTAGVVGLGLLVVAPALAGSVPPPTSACPNGLPKCFLPNTPALAADLNLDLDTLRAWIEQKVGANGTAGVQVDSVSSVGAVAGSAVSATGAVSGASVSATGAVTGASLTATSGDIKLGTQFAPRSPENLRLVRGTLMMNGVHSGAGFTASITGSRWIVNFTQAFASTSQPTVLCTVGPGAGSADACNIVSLSNSGFVIDIGVRNIGWYSNNLTFIAVGEK